jgi:glutathione S-transferase
LSGGHGIVTAECAKGGERALLKIWGRKNSSNVQKTMWAVGELGLAYERIDIGMEYGGNETPGYRAMNPNGLVPTIQDGDFVLWESNSIIRYLAARHGAGKLEPSDLRSRAVASQWMDWQVSVFFPAFAEVFFNLVRTPPDQRNPARIAAAKAKSIDAAKILDTALARNAYLAGNSFSMGDIPMGVFIYRFRVLLTDRPSLPNLERWYAAIEERSAFQKHVSSIPIT